MQWRALHAVVVAERGRLERWRLRHCLRREHHACLLHLQGGKGFKEGLQQNNTHRKAIDRGEARHFVTAGCEEDCASDGRV